MRISLSLLLLALTVTDGLASDEVSPEVAAIGMLPKQRTAQRLAPSERNPFAVKPKEANKVATEETETQESKIRALFKAMNVTGVRRGTDGRLIALAGDLILREGEEVKPVLSDQTEILVVSKIDQKKLELTFVENKDSTQPRTIVMSTNNQPRVAQKLFGQAKGAKEMYYPAARAVAAGVATVLSVATGSGAASPSQTAIGTEHGSPGGGVASGIGVITAPPPPAPIIAASERISFAALAPGGTGSAATKAAPSTPPTPPVLPFQAADLTASKASEAMPLDHPPSQGPAIGSSSSSVQGAIAAPSDTVPSVAAPATPPQAPTPAIAALAPLKPVEAPPAIKKPTPEPAVSPLRLAVPPPPASKRPVIE